MNTTEPAKPEPDVDNLLADFTDRLLSGEAPQLAPESEPVLRSLEQSVLQLHQALPHGPADEATRQRMLHAFRERSRQVQPAAPVTSRASRQSRQRLLVAFAVVIVLAILIASPVFLPGVPDHLQGTATLPQQDIALLIVFGGVLIALIWLGRRR